MISRDPVASLVEALASGGVEIVDLTQPLNERTPVIQLPEQFEQTPGLKVHEISRYDERGPAWAWNWLEIGEHAGTHFDAPVHWITDRKSTRLNSSHANISYAVFCLKKKKQTASNTKS